MTGATLTLRAAGLSDVGRRRDVNEDRFHIDVNRGVFLVVDGVGGQAAGGKAADIAVHMLRERLERQTGPPDDRVREAVTIANNEIFRAASQRREWHGMACVLTVAVVEHGRAVIGHVGDTRLYLLRGGHVEKITPDHSPVGVREDAHEISEAEAMRHPRRNEVFRDVGSAAHGPDDDGFLFVGEIEFPSDAALLICSDGLTDLVPLDAIRHTIESHKGHPDDVVAALVQAANDAGGKDNVTVVYVEGADFASGPSLSGGPARAAHTLHPAPRGRGWLFMTLALLMAIAIGGWFAWRAGWIDNNRVPSVFTPGTAGAIVVKPDESIAAAIDRAQPGFVVLVEPGDYRERLTLKDNVRVVSRVPRGATLRLPGSATEQDAAVVAAGVTGAELSGFQIVGDAASPLGTGIVIRDAAVRLVDLEISGATVAAIDLGRGDDVLVLGCDVHDNSGAALVARTGSTARIAHNTFTRNAASASAASAFAIEPGAAPVWSRNVFDSAGAQVLGGVDDAARQAIVRNNWFVDTRPGAHAARAAGAGRGR